MGLSLAQDKPAYLLYSAKGKKLSYKAALEQIQKADVIFFGELHNNPIAHWLTYEIAKDLHQRAPGKLLIGMEMLETDGQEAVSAYLKGEVASWEQLKDRIRLWPNFETDYAPLIEWAKNQKVPVYATNAPALMVRQLAKEGLQAAENWDSEKRKWIAPLPFPRLDTLPSYRRMEEMAHGHGISAERLRLAQMLRDATMAHFIAQAWKPGKIFLHVNGRYHSDYKEGIAAYLRLYRPEVRIVVITTEETPNPTTYRHPDPAPADIIVVVPETMTKTH